MRNLPEKVYGGVDVGLHRWAAVRGPHRRWAVPRDVYYRQDLSIVVPFCTRWDSPILRTLLTATPTYARLFLDVHGEREARLGD